MMIPALIALLAAAIAGAVLAIRHFLRKGLPASVAVLHGLGGAVGLAFVLVAILRQPDFAPIRTVLYLLIATVILGCINLLFHVRGVRHRASIIVLHGLTAIASAAMLLQAIVTDVVPAPPSIATTTSLTTVSERTQETVPVAQDDHAATPTDTASKHGIQLAASPNALADDVRRALAQVVRFETNGRNVPTESRYVIAELAGVLRAHPEITLVEVQGHADERGDDATNVALTRMRAAAVVGALVAQGVAPERLSAAGYGARCPLAAPRTAANTRWEQDRRVAFVPLEVDGAPLGAPVTCDRGRDLVPPEDRRFGDR